MKISHRVRVGVGGGLLLAGALTALVAAPASAHNYLVSSNPAVGSVVTEAPEVISVTTNDALLDLAGDGTSAAVQVQDASGRYFNEGCATVSGATASSATALGAAGVYTVTWRVVSTDGHPVSDSFEFTWQPGADFVAAEGTSEPPACGDAAGEAALAGTDDPAAQDVVAESGIEAGIESDVLWIVGAIVAVVLAVGVTLFVARRPVEKGPAEKGPVKKGPER